MGHTKYENTIGGAAQSAAPPRCRSTYQRPAATAITTRTPPATPSGPSAAAFPATNAPLWTIRGRTSVKLAEPAFGARYSAELTSSKYRQPPESVASRIHHGTMHARNAAVAAAPPRRHRHQAHGNAPAAVAIPTTRTYVPAASSTPSTTHRHSTAGRTTSALAPASASRSPGLVSFEL